MLLTTMSWNLPTAKAHKCQINNHLWISLLFPKLRILQVMENKEFKGKQRESEIIQEFKS